MTFAATTIADLSFDEDRHLYRHKEQIVPSVTQVLEAAGLRDSGFYSESSRWRGTQVHRICELWDQGDLGDFDQEFAGYLEAWKAFMARHNAVVLAAELPVFSRQHMVAGRLDRFMISALWPRPKLIDLKSGPYDDTVGLQTAGYEIGWLDGPRLIPGHDRRLTTFDRGSVHLHADGTFKFREHADPMDGNVFLCALSVVNWRARYRKENPWKT